MVIIKQDLKKKEKIMTEKKGGGKEEKVHRIRVTMNLF